MSMKSSPFPKARPAGLGKKPKARPADLGLTPEEIADLQAKMAGDVRKQAYGGKVSKMNKGGKMRGAGAATKGTRFSGCY